MKRTSLRTFEIKFLISNISIFCRNLIAEVRILYTPPGIYAKTISPYDSVITSSYLLRKERSAIDILMKILNAINLPSYCDAVKI
jgi:hypothetical protein